MFFFSKQALSTLLAIGVLWLVAGCESAVDIGPGIPPPPSPTDTDACYVATDSCYTVEYLGYEDYADGMTGVMLRVANQCTDALRALTVGTQGWTRISPLDRSRALSRWGLYEVSWSAAQGGGGLTGIRYTAQFDALRAGADDRFTLVVDGFDANSTLPISERRYRAD
ncbi:MAG: hypothetical protein KDE31_33605 [Caldilineaceae bacterium]|nr:hypothetical protein [Caldilineaceae bacterium]